MPINVKDTINGSNFTGTVNGYSIAKSVPSNAVFTDTNTWRPVVDNLTSTATDQSLSANQGRALKALVDGKAATSHGTHVTYGTSTTALTSGGTGVVGSSSTLARADHTHTLPAYPTALKSPGALTLSLNGTSQGAYDGSAAKSINITASSIGAASSSHGTHISDTGWKNFTLASGISLASGGVARYRKINNIVYVEMNVTGISHAGSGATAVTTTLATLPSGYRPSSYLPIDGTAGASQPNPCRIECNTNGTIRFRSSLNKVTAEYTLHVSFNFMI